MSLAHRIAKPSDPTMAVIDALGVALADSGATLKVTGDSDGPSGPRLFVEIVDCAEMRIELDRTAYDLGGEYPLSHLLSQVLISISVMGAKHEVD